MDYANHNRLGARLLAGAGVLTAVFLLLPLVILTIQSFTAQSYLAFPPPVYGIRWYKEVFASPEWREAASTSLLIAATTTPLAVVFGTLAALGLDRGPMRGRRAMYAFAISPLTLPHLILGLGLLQVALRLGIDDTFWAFVPAHLTVTIPFVIISVGASLQTFDRRLEAAAQSLGASPWRAFWHVTLPIIKPGIVGGAIFAFITSFDEFIITYFLAIYTKTLPIEIFSSLMYQVSPSIAAISVLTLALSALLLVILIARGQVIGGGTIVK